jgi:uncharacterized protein
VYHDEGGAPHPLSRSGSLKLPDELKSVEECLDAMNLALNYSRPAAELLDAGRLTIDLLKTFDDPDVVAASRAAWPTYVHFGLMAGLGQTDGARADTVARMYEAPHTHHVNTHLAPKVTDFPGMALDTRSPEDAARVEAAMRRDIEPLIERFGAGRAVPVPASVPGAGVHQPVGP